MTETPTAEPAVPRPLLASLRDALLRHFDTAQRDLPWRKTRDPYAIWVSEVMLQQTRVDTVIPYYARFLARFPTPRTLADAPLDAVLAAWSGLGYYRRARMLHAGARAVVADHGGTVPSDPVALRALPGVGEYTAGAIASIAFQQRAALVDGNVERVVTRLFALGGDPRAALLKKQLWSIAGEFADCDRPGDVNQALMELGATVCVPVAPRCLLCPAQTVCAARRAGEPERYPEKVAKRAPRDEAWRALVAVDRERKHVWLVPSEIGRWEGMLLVPMVPADGADAARPLLDALDARALGCTRATAAGTVKHVLTHAVMLVAVHRATATRAAPRGRMVPLADLPTLAVPRITHAILEAAL